jgi:hypothetical protein
MKENNMNIISPANGHRLTDEEIANAIQRIMAALKRMNA